MRELCFRVETPSQAELYTPAEHGDSCSEDGRLLRQVGTTDLGNLAAGCSECRIGAGVLPGNVVCECKTGAMRNYKRGTVAAGPDGRGSSRAQE